MNLHLDPTEFAPIIDQAVEATLRRLQAGRPMDEAGLLLLDKRSAARALSMSISTLDRITVPRGDLPAVRLHGKVLYSPDTLRKWTAAKEAEGDGIDEHQ